MECASEISFNKSEYLTTDEINDILTTIIAGYKHPSSEFFKDGDKLLKQFTKQGVITVEDEEDLHLKNSTLCNVLGCNQSFETIFAYESHYNSLHRYLCSQCKKSLPSSHLLDLHISEQHDSFFAAQAERKPMYACFLEECDHKSSNSEERRDHCIRIHKFPANFRFDNFSTHLPKGRKSPDGKMEIVDENSDEKVRSDKSAKTKKMISFGHPKARTFAGKKGSKPQKSSSDDSMDTSPLEDEKTVTDLMDSLPSEDVN